MLDTLAGCGQFFFTGIMAFVEFGPNCGAFFVIGFYKTRKGFLGKQTAF
ncbi:MAG: hypothetical protein FWF24_04760 [Alphaproteobacteria bacterium]|nr:hypothetical protein [Alphaproteobacteria bacterium]